MTLRSLLDLVLVLAAFVVAVGALCLFGALLWAGAWGPVHFGWSVPWALAFDAALCLAFFLQHSGMVRRSVRRALGRVVSPHAVGAVYAIASGLVLGALVLLWQPTTPALLEITGWGRTLVRGAFGLGLLGFGIVLLALSSNDLLGTRPILDRWRGRTSDDPPLAVKGPYRWVRHPAYALTIVLLWACPTWTADRLVLATLFSAWIVVGARLEERDLLEHYGAEYVAFRQRVPMLFPWCRR